jgi:hypothetical protein
MKIGALPQVKGLKESVSVKDLLILDGASD